MMCLQEISYDPLPNLKDVADYLSNSRKPLAAEVLREARAKGTLLLQPRCGVGGQAEMISLLRHLDVAGHADLLTLTIDSYTRLRHFDRAERLLSTSPAQLNGYPLVAHGWRAARELNEAFEKPIQVRHGSPDAQTLFATSIAAGLSSFEGGGICYNLPYCKDVPLKNSLQSWQSIDAACGRLQADGFAIDREFFGSLSGVLVPPAISLALVFLEAWLAAREGCRCLSLAIPQNGSLVQDVAALRLIPRLAQRYLPDDAEVFPVLHQFMGVFPKDPAAAEQLIFLGGLTARLGGAAKTITKTPQEAIGIPDGPANVQGLRATRTATQSLQFNPLCLPEDALEEEMHWLERETRELIDPILSSPDPVEAILTAFNEGRLDIPFPSSQEAKGAVIPVRDASLAVRYARVGNLPFSEPVMARNRALVAHAGCGEVSYTDVLHGIFFFAEQAMKQQTSN